MRNTVSMNTRYKISIHSARNCASENLRGGGASVPVYHIREGEEEMVKVCH